MATPGVGQDIEALCGRCGQVWHVVMAKMGDRIAKVVCKRCGGNHRYRSEGELEDASARGSRGSSSSSSRRMTRPRASSAEPRSLPSFDASKPPRPYAPRDSYDPGDRLAHSSFGVGIVSGSPGAGKVEVVFPSGVRVLACAKAASTLARPVAVLDLPISDRPPK